jgi:hypothetical protein
MGTIKPGKELLEAMQAAGRAVTENARTDHIYGVRAGESPLAVWPLEPCSIVFLDFDGVLPTKLMVRLRF